MMQTLSPARMFVLFCLALLAGIAPAAAQNQAQTGKLKIKGGVQNRRMSSWMAAPFATEAKPSS